MLFLNDPERLFLSIRRVPIRRGPVFVNPKRFRFGGALFLSIQRGPIFVFCNLEGSQFGGVLILPIRRGPILGNPVGPNSEGTYFCQFGGVLFCQSGVDPIQRNPNFVNSEGS